jgi:hypothetical protein
MSVDDINFVHLALCTSSNNSINSQLNSLTNSTLINSMSDLVRVLAQYEGLRVGLYMAYNPPLD